MDENNFADVMSLSVFMSLSALVTGFTEFQLHGTGMAEAYYDTLSKQTGSLMTQEYLLTYTTIQKQAGSDGDELNSLFRKTILCDEKFGPVTRNIIKMWYVGIWYELPEEWHAKYGEPASPNLSYFVSPQAYTEGLLWPAIGSHPAGAKAPGYGTWKDKPVFENI